jgi:hypothetical protein
MSEYKSIADKIPKKMMMVNSVPSKKAETLLVVLNWDSSGADIDTFVARVKLVLISLPLKSMPVLIEL